MKEAKCIIWDLDDTIWEGTLLEDNNVQLKPEIKQILIELDKRGILNSIASKNDHDRAIEKLKEFQIEEYFLFPQINWNTKSHSIGRIQESLNIGIDTLVFIDDQPFEREEVLSVHPQVECIPADKYSDILEKRRVNPKHITIDSGRRRSMYTEDIIRTNEESNFKGPKDQFLANLNMEFIISNVEDGDLERAEELTIRTNQFNATGKTYDYSELKALSISPNHKLLVGELKDKFGTYGKIGLALVEMKGDYWYLRMMLMSCRVISRGLGTILLNFLMSQCKKENKIFRADFKQTAQNRIMYMTYKMANFKEISNNNGDILFENDASQLQRIPDYIKLTIK